MEYGGKLAGAITWHIVECAAEAGECHHPEAGEHLISDTFLRFKGLERPWVIVSELYLGGNRYDVRMHVALTRATVGCVIVATGEQIDSDERLVRVS